ncbi:MAG: DNA 3'-phosphatase [Colwellia sp.]|nr:DNA 3'-phosphatase [Colwellia sp.]
MHITVTETSSVITICGDHHFSQIQNQVKIAAFDVDNTIIKPKSGKMFAQSVTDWEFLYENVPEKLQRLHFNGFKVIFISNQKGISKNKVDPREYIAKMTNIIEILNIPITVYAAKLNDHNRKPSIGIWNSIIMAKIQSEYNLTLLIPERESAEQIPNQCNIKGFYCGDAAGRDLDFSDSDLMFANNVNITYPLSNIIFYTPEQFFESDLQELSQNNETQNCLNNSDEQDPERQRVSAQLQYDFIRDHENLLFRFEQTRKSSEPYRDEITQIAIGGSTRSHYLKREHDPANSTQNVSPEGRNDLPCPEQHQELIINVGYPGSGKSTFTENFISQATVNIATAVRTPLELSTDVVSVASRYHYINQDKLKTLKKCLKETEKLIKLGKSVIIDNTNCSTSVRRLYIDISYKYGIPIRCFNFISSFNKSYHNMLYRNYRSSHCFNDSHIRSEIQFSRIPIIAYYKYRKHFQIPQLNEGLTSIYNIKDIKSSDMPCDYNMIFE